MSALKPHYIFELHRHLPQPRHLDDSPPDDHRIGNPRDDLRPESLATRAQEQERGRTLGAAPRLGERERQTAPRDSAAQALCVLPCPGRTRPGAGSG